MKVLLIKSLLRVFSWLPPRLIYRAGGLLGSLFYALSGSLKKTTMANLRLCLPDRSEAELRALGRQSLQETARTALEMGPAWIWPVDRLMKQVVSVSGRELWEEARERGRGIIMVGPHLGNWEVMGLYLSVLGPATHLYQPPNLEGFSDFMRKGRSRSGADLVPTSRQGIVALVKALKRNELVGILPDQTPRAENGVLAPFFGHEALTMTLVSKLAAKTGAAVVFAFARRLERGEGFEVAFRPAREGIASTDLREATTALNRSVEACVLECPAQYQWEYKRFKRAPGQRRIYRKGYSEAPQDHTE